MDTLSMSETWLRINNTTDSITFTEDLTKYIDIKGNIL